MITFRDIDLIVYDFDGVMTDNKVLLSQDGQESVILNRADGMGVSLFKNKGVKQIIISTETNPIVTLRAKKLEIDVMQDVKDKKYAIIKVCDKMNYDLSKIVFVGNDVNDLEAMKIVGVPIAPHDAHEKILNIAKIITKAKGGDGVIRELFDLIRFQSDRLH